ncbi:winged helix-turn-helix domain-containing protein [Bradyrhizobium sp. USDA 313]|uniref:winged helix-turn-helix domain-containing protein n=1 Tax=Bradyrhizobium sp. USDA 313 TaxID=3156307 RepID=UPI003518F6CE
MSALSALAKPTRLAIFRLLVKHEPVGITAGVIADTNGAPHKTLSTRPPLTLRKFPHHLSRIKTNDST